MRVPEGKGSESIEVFCCYARKDRPLLQELTNHLMSLKREGLITLWADTDINAGAEWEKEIHFHLDAAQIILLLISPDFLASEYCYGIEMQRAVQRHKRGEARVIPIILRPTVSWQRMPFGRFQALPTSANPITSGKWHHQDEAFYEVVEGIRNVVVSLNEEKRHLDEEEQFNSIETQASPQLSQVPLSTVAAQPCVGGAIHGTSQRVIPVPQFSFNLVLRGSLLRSVRLLVFWIILTLYWLLLGFFFYGYSPKGYCA